MKTSLICTLLLTLLVMPAIAVEYTPNQANTIALGRFAGTFALLKGRGDTKSRDDLLAVSQHAEGVEASIEQTGDNPAKYKLVWADKKTGKTYPFMLSHADFVVFMSAYENFVCGKSGLPHDPQVCKRGNRKK
jgi:hypothetical protein